MGERGHERRQEPIAETARQAPATAAPVPAAAPVGQGFDFGRIAIHGGEGRDAGDDAGSIARRGLAGVAERLPYLSELRASMEGHRLDNIAVHRDEHAVRAAGALGAAGYALGDRIALAPGAGLRTVAHEVAHVLWQRAGWAPAEGVGRLNDAYEKAADAVAARVVRRIPAVEFLPPVGAFAPRRAVQFDILGRVPEGTDPATPTRTVPTGATTEDVLAEMEKYVQSQAAKLPATQQAAKIERTLLGIAAGSFELYDSKLKRIGTYAFDGTVPFDLPTGFYLDRGPGYQLTSAAAQGNKFYWGLFTADDGRGYDLGKCFSAKTLKQLNDDAAKHNVLAMLFVVPPPGTSTGKATKKDATWAEGKVGKIKKRLRKLAEAKTQSKGEKRTGEGPKNSTQAADADKERKKSEKAPDKQDTAEKPPRDIPDELWVWSNEKGVYVNVWADGAHKALPLDEGETEEEIEKRIQDTTKELRDARDPELSVKVADGAKKTGFTKAPPVPPPKGAPKGEGKGTYVGPPPDPESVIPGAKKTANTPGYPSQIINYGSDITVSGATNRFEMRIDYRPAGNTTLDQVAARMQRINYYWELIDVTDVKPEERKNVSRQTEAGKGEQVGPASGANRDLARKMENLGEDNVADLEDLTSGSALEIATTWQARAAWLGVIGISSVVRSVGGVVSWFIDMATKPLNEQSIGFDKEGDFLVRCIATPVADDDAVIIRASSVSATAIRVQNINTRATEANVKELDELAKLREKLAQTPEGPERDALMKEIAAREAAGRQNVAENATTVLAGINDALTALTELEQANLLGKPKSERSIEARLLDVNLQLAGVSIDEYRKMLEKQKTDLEELIGRTKEFADEFSGTNYRPVVTLASEENGQVIQMLMMLGEAPGSDKSKRKYSLVDVTSKNTQQTYHGTSKQEGLAGHEEAIRNAFVDFRENAEYGRGTLAIRLPDNLATDLGGPIAIDSRMRMAPGSHARAMGRLSDLATAAEVAALVITGPVGMAIGAVGAVAGAIVAIDAIQKRRSGHRFEVLSFQTMMDVLSVVGAAAAVAGVGAVALRNSAKWISKVEKVQEGLHIFGATQLGAQVFIIPIQLSMQLDDIDKIEGLSPGERSARKAEAFLSAVKSGVVTIVSAAQMLESKGMGAQRGELPTGFEEPAVKAKEGEPTKAPAEGGAEVAPTEVTPAKVKPTEVTPAEVKPTEVKPTEVKPAEGGPAVKPAAKGKPAAKATAHPAPRELSAERTIELQPGLSDLTGVKIMESPELSGTSARVRIINGEVVIEVGPKATAQHVADHVNTARVYLRFTGALGRIRLLIDKVLSALKLRQGITTQGGESRLEVKKLSDIMTRLELMRDGVLARIEEAEAPSAQKDAKAKQVELEQEIAAIEAQLKEHQALVDSYAPGRGFVAAFGASPGPTLETLQTRFAGDSFSRKGSLIRINDMIELRSETIGKLDQPGTDPSAPTALDHVVAGLRKAGLGDKLSVEEQAALKGVVASLGPGEAASNALRRAVDPSRPAPPPEAAKFLKGEALSEAERTALAKGSPELGTVADVLDAAAKAKLPVDAIRKLLLDGSLFPEHQARLAEALQDLINGSPPVKASDLSAMSNRFRSPQELAQFIEALGSGRAAQHALLQKVFAEWPDLLKRVSDEAKEAKGEQKRLWGGADAALAGIREKLGDTAISPEDLAAWARDKSTGRILDTVEQLLDRGELTVGDIRDLRGMSRTETPPSTTAPKPLAPQETAGMKLAIGLDILPEGQSKATDLQSDLQRFAMETGSLHFSEWYRNQLTAIYPELPGADNPAVKEFYEKQGKQPPPWSAVFKDVLSRFTGKFVINLEGMAVRKDPDAPSAPGRPAPAWSTALPADLLALPQGRLLEALAMRGEGKPWVGGVGGTITETEIFSMLSDWPGLYTAATGNPFVLKDHLVIFSGGKQVWP